MISLLSRRTLRRLFASLLLLPAVVASADDPLEEVVVSATALRKSSLEVAQPTSVLSGDALVRERGTSIGEALANTAGVSATWFGPQASRPMIRGQTGERVLISEDGAESLDVAALSADHAVTIDPLLADRVEVLRGPATLLYGNGAAGGLVNVVVRRVPETAVDHGLTGAGEMRFNSALNERAAAMRLEGGSDGWAFHGDAYARETSDVSIAGFALSRNLRESGEFSDEHIEAGRGRIPDSASSLHGGALGVSRVGEGGFAGVAVSRFETRYGLPGPEEGISINLQQTRFDFNSDWLLDSDWLRSVRGRFSFNRYEHAEIEGDGEVATQFDQDGLAARVAIETAEIAGWRGSFGVQLRDVDFSALGEEAFVPPSQTRNLGLFAYEERAFGPVTVELGARLEQQTVSSAELPGYDSARGSFAGGLVWKFADNWSSALNVTSTTRHPTSTELYSDGPHLAVQRFEIGDATLRPERATTLDLAVRHRSETWGMGLTAYQSDYSDYIYTRLTGDVEDGLPVAEYLQSDARFTGLEAELELPALPFAGGKVDTRLVADLVRARLEDGGDLPQIPPLRLGTEVRYSRLSWSVGVAAHHFAEQDRVAENELPTGSYTMLCADASWRVTLGDRDLLVFIRGDNLLDEEARRHNSPIKDYAPLPGVSLGAGVRLDF